MGKRGKNPLCIEDVLKMEPPVKKRFSNLSAKEISRMAVEKDSKYTQKVNVCLCLDQAVNHKSVRVFFSLNRSESDLFVRFGMCLLKTFGVFAHELQLSS